ncbi:hypothetical protein [Nocardia brasiliensis]|uniref:hypothetical protein n=1 Tax=Nocardia brasiliensis TaxID=37326 RepID=UPI00245470C7|nr:hypothetical protein [Nocardia brasiliensis]
MAGRLCQLDRGIQPGLSRPEYRALDREQTSARQRNGRRLEADATDQALQQHQKPGTRLSGRAHRRPRTQHGDQQQRHLGQSQLDVIGHIVEPIRYCHAELRQLLGVRTQLRPGLDDTAPDVTPGIEGAP